MEVQLFVLTCVIHIYDAKTKSRHYLATPLCVLLMLNHNTDHYNRIKRILLKCCCCCWNDDQQVSSHSAAKSGVQENSPREETTVADVDTTVHEISNVHRIEMKTQQSLLEFSDASQSE